MKKQENTQVRGMDTLVKVGKWITITAGTVGIVSTGIYLVGTFLTGGF